VNVPAESEAGVRLAELVASLSLATDLGLGQPMEHSIRQTRIALRLADRLGLGEEDRIATYYTGLLVNVYCHSDAYEQARWFGDDIRLKADTYVTDMETVRGLLLIMRRLGAGESGLARARTIAAFPAQGWREIDRILHTHCTLQSEFAARVGLSAPVCEALLRTYERWDGRGVPDGLPGDQIPLPSRIVSLANVVEVHHRAGGIDAARAVARERSGGEFDPNLVELLCSDAGELLSGLDSDTTWRDVIDAEPGLARFVRGDALDDVLEAMADLVDMKSPHLAGHSRGVANLAAEAAGVAGEDVRVLRRAGLVHDLGRLGVSNAIWDKPGPLTASEFERVRLHPYLTDRMLAGLAALAPVRTLAARHHERLDGSGYPLGLSAAELSPADRLLAAADVYHAMTEPRPHRPALDGRRAAAQLRIEVGAGRLDGDAVNAVLKAAGHRAPARRMWPAGLTTREVEVLRLLARGQSNKQIAAALVVTPKTVSTHVEHIYSKLGVSSRAQATLFAIQHGLLGSFEADSGRAHSAKNRANAR
jgi:HD-GYP domain-containing protein (c-di-GMP phosphodiesterase class II)